MSFGCRITIALGRYGPPAFGRPAAVRLGVLAVSSLALGVVLFHAGPSFLDAAFAATPKRGAPVDDLGETPYFAALFVFVNIHHYFMDSVIWRRDSPETRHLVDP